MIIYYDNTYNTASNCEDWKEEKIRTKNRADESLLNDKYQRVYLYDSDTNKVRRIIHVERSTAAIYAVINQLVN